MSEQNRAVLAVDHNIAEFSPRRGEKRYSACSEFM